MNAIRTIPHRPSGTWRPDVTVATIVQRDGRFLLVEEMVGGRCVLNQPAGHLEAGESLVEAARRETLEETAWHVAPTDLVTISQWSNAPGGRHFLRFTFAAEAERHEPERRLDAGIVRAAWLSRDEIAAAHERLRSPIVLASIDDWIEGRRYPLDMLNWFAPGRAARATP
jgi:ADP-ribose pyrophosphatase YjhB (NUDIX family)